jgi:hypothetical protein
VFAGCYFVTEVSLCVFVRRFNQMRQSQKGSCRDILDVDSAFAATRHRAVFVSGYYYFEMDQPAYELHGWVTIFYQNGMVWVWI